MVSDLGGQRKPPWRRAASCAWKILPWGISAVLLAILFRSLGPNVGQLGHLQWEWVIGALAVSLSGNVLLASYKLWLLLRWTNLAVPWRRVLRLILGLLAATFFTPFQTGHVLYGVALGRIEGKPYLAALEAVFFDKWMTLCGTTALMALGWAFLPPGHPFNTPLLLLGALAVTALPFLGFLARLAGHVPWLDRHSHLVAHPLSLRRKAVLLLLATLYQCTDVLSVWMGARALGVQMPATGSLAIVPGLLLMTYLPVTLSGLGLREHLVAVLFGGFLTWEQGLQVGLFVDAAEYLAPALVGTVALPRLLQGVRRGRKPEEGPEGRRP